MVLSFASFTSRFGISAHRFIIRIKFKHIFNSFAMRDLVVVVFISTVNMTLGVSMGEDTVSFQTLSTLVV